jgi:DNA repair exonuclease SbcCD nuclease subunit
VSKYKALFTADIHMSNSLPHSQPANEDGVTDRLLDQKALWQKIHDSAIEHHVDAIFVLGDLFDSSSVDPATLIVTSEALNGVQRLPHNLYILPGNHEANGRLFISGAFAHFGNDKISYMGGAEELCVNEWLRFWPMGYSTTEQLMERIGKAKQNMKFERAPAEVALLHHSIIGCSHFGWVCDDGVVAENVCGPFDQVYAGHFHENQLFGQEENGMYLGAPMHHRFDDANRAAGWWIIEWNYDGKNVSSSREYVHSVSPRFHVVKWNKSESAINLSRQVRSMVKPGDYLRFVVEATHSEWTKIKPQVSRVVGYFCDQGMRASWKYKPLYHHGRRLKSKSTSAGSLDLAASIDAYVDAPDVDTSGLRLKHLKQLGREFLERTVDSFH